MAYSERYPNEAPAVNRLLDTLSNPRRRELIHYFESRSQIRADSLDTVVSHIDGRMPSASQTELETSLHHKHIPKLEARGWIDYDARGEEIRYYGNEGAEEVLQELLSAFSE
jgi:hypothetical protein